MEKGPKPGHIKSQVEKDRHVIEQQQFVENYRSYSERAQRLKDLEEQLRNGQDVLTAEPGAENLSIEEQITGYFVRAFKRREKTNQTGHQQILDYLGKHHTIQDQEPASIGAALFTHLTGQQPTGQIDFIKETGRVMLFCSEIADFNQMKAKWDRLKDKNVTDIAGMYLTQVNIPTPGDGWRKADMAYLSNLLLIHGDKDTADGNRTLRHEWQHAVNDMISLGIADKSCVVENGLVFQTAPDGIRQSNIKDEVLAYLKGGSLRQMGSFIDSQTYSHLGGKPYAETLKKISEAIQGINADEVLSNTDLDLLVNHLLFVPLEHMEEYIQDLQRYLEPVSFNIPMEIKNNPVYYRLAKDQNSFAQQLRAVQDYCTVTPRLQRSMQDTSQIQKLSAALEQKELGKIDPYIEILRSFEETNQSGKWLNSDIHPNAATIEGIMNIFSLTQSELISLMSGSHDQLEDFFIDREKMDPQLSQYNLISIYKLTALKKLNITITLDMRIPADTQKPFTGRQLIEIELHYPSLVISSE